MVRFLVLYDTPEAFDRHYRGVHILLAKQASAADVPNFAPAGVASVLYEVEEV
jgi:hypothetical protein